MKDRHFTCPRCKESFEIDHAFCPEQEGSECMVCLYRHQEPREGQSGHTAEDLYSRFSKRSLVNKAKKKKKAKALRQKKQKRTFKQMDAVSDLYHS